MIIVCGMFCCNSLLFDEFVIIFSVTFIGVIHLVKDHEVCKEGDVLTPETAKILVGFI